MASPLAAGQPVEPATEPSEPTPATPADTSDDTLDFDPLLDDALGGELLLFEDIPIVISATRRPQRQMLASAPVSVITADFLHYSGITNVPEALQFTPGVDYLKIDRNRAAIGVRGSHDWASDRTLTLVDGRSAVDPAAGTSQLMRLPLFLEDIDRIEVVRGPGGAAWGANAFNGVINVMMKKPEDLQGALASLQVNEYGDVFSQVRIAERAGDWAWRLSGGYESRESSEDAVDDDDFTSNDFARNTRFDFEASRPTDNGTFRAGLAYGHFEEGDFELTLRQPFDTGETEVARAFARLEHNFDNGATGHVQWYGNFMHANEPSLYTRDTYENDFEGQYNFDYDDKHEVSLGANVRTVYINGKVKDVQDLMIRDEVHNDYWFGAFALDRWQMRDRFVLETQARLDYYNETGLDWSGRIAGIQSLDDNDRNVVRLSAAKAFRAPLRTFTDGAFVNNPLPSPPFPPGSFATTLIPADDLENEETYSFELGFSSAIDEHLFFRADAYYQIYEDLIGVQVVSSTPPISVFQFDNIDGADAFGIETELSAHYDDLTLSIWYAYNDFEADQTDQDIRAFHPAKHKVGATGRLAVTDGVVASANYRWTDSTQDEGGALSRSVPSTHRLDTTLAFRIRHNGELLVGVADLFDDTDVEAPGIGSFAPHETPGRTFFVRFQLTF